MELKGKLDVINGKEYIELPGYPNFRFRFDRKTRKYSIINSKYIGTKETDPFIDEIIYSEVPLETWTANYIVVRIGEFFYLADPDGNCYFEDKEGFIIGRNLFLSKSCKFLINNKFKKIDVSAYKMVVKTVAGYNFICKKVSEIEDLLLSADGKTEINILNKTGLTDWYTENNGKQFFNKEFKATSNVKYSVMYGTKSRTYTNVHNKELIKTHFCEAYSTYFHATVQILIYGELEIVKYDGKVYFFDKDGNVEQNDASDPFFIRMHDMIFYRIGTTVYVRNKDGKLLEPIQIEWSQLYQYILMEKQVELSLAIKLSGGN